MSCSKEGLDHLVVGSESEVMQNTEFYNHLSGRQHIGGSPPTTIERHPRWYSPANIQGMENLYFSFI